MFTEPWYIITVTFTDLNWSDWEDGFYTLWGTSFCGNDVVTDKVPPSWRHGADGRLPGPHGGLCPAAAQHVKRA